MHCRQKLDFVPWNVLNEWYCKFCDFKITTKINFYNIFIYSCCGLKLSLQFIRLAARTKCKTNASEKICDNFIQIYLWQYTWQVKK